MAVSDICSKFAKALDDLKIAEYVSDADAKPLMLMKQVCGDAYFIRSSSLSALENSRYDREHDNLYYVNNPDVIRSEDFKVYLDQAADADKALERCKYYLRSALLQWGESTLPH